MGGTLESHELGDPFNPRQNAHTSFSLIPQLPIHPMPLTRFTFISDDYEAHHLIPARWDGEWTHKRVLELMPLRYIYWACTHVRRVAFTLNPVKIPLSIEIIFQRPQSPTVCRDVLEHTVDFAKCMKLNAFYSETSATLIDMAIDIFQVAAEARLVKFREQVACTVISFDWVVHDIGLVKIDFNRETLFLCDVVTLRRSKLPLKQIGGWRPVPFDESRIRRTIETMLKFWPV